MVFLFKNGDTLFVAPAELSESKDVFKYITKAKKSLSTNNLVSGIDNSGELLKFMEHIFNLGYYDKPDYEMLV